MITKKDVIRALIPLGDFKEIGEQLKFNCPVCEKNGAPVDRYNLEINIQKNSFHCWACNNHGTIYKLVQELGIKEMAHLFKKERNDTAEKANEQILELPQECYSVLRNGEATKYLIEARGLTKEIIKQRDIKWCFSGRYRNSILFPSYTTEGALNYFISHNFATKKYYTCKGFSKNVCFYESFLDKRAPIIITEGIYDALSVANACPSNGVELTEATLINVANCDILLGFDSFIASTTLKKAVNQLTAMGCSVEVVEIPRKYKDLNEIAMQDKNLLRELLSPYYTKFTA